MKKVWDSVTQDKINSLHPSLRKRATDFINALDKDFGIKARIYEGFRHPERQAELYAQGRTTPGAIVTFAKPGESLHEYGLAFDLVEIKDNKALWINDNWAKIGELGKSYGFRWGGDFISIKDNPHFEDSQGFTTTQLASMEKIGNYPKLT